MIFWTQIKNILSEFMKRGLVYKVSYFHNNKPHIFSIFEITGCGSLSCKYGNVAE